MQGRNSELGVEVWVGENKFVFAIVLQIAQVCEEDRDVHPAAREVGGKPGEATERGCQWCQMLLIVYQVSAW